MKFPLIHQLPILHDPVLPDGVADAVRGVDRLRDLDLAPLLVGRDLRVRSVAIHQQCVYCTTRRWCATYGNTRRHGFLKLSERSLVVCKAFSLD